MLASPSLSGHGSTVALPAPHPAPGSASPSAPLWTQVCLGMSVGLTLAWTALMARYWIQRWKTPPPPPVATGVSHLPCLNCAYLHGNVHLPCAVNPRAALTAEALHCADFTPKLAADRACQGVPGPRG